MSQVENVEVNVRELFVHGGHHDAVRVTSEPMHHPWLLNYCFDFRSDKFKFENGQFSQLVRRYCELALEEIKDPLNLIKKGLGGQRDMPNGLFGDQNLADLDEEWDGFAKKVVVGLTGVHLKLQKVGNCLAIECQDSQGKVHELSTRIFKEIVDTSRYLSRFHHRFDVTYRHSNREFDLATELREIERRVPAVTWYRSEVESVATQLFDQFSGENSEDVQVGEFHGQSVYLSMELFHSGQEKRQCDANWRRGFIKHRSATALAFREAGSDPRLFLRYFVRTRAHVWFHEVDHDIDHDTEQSVMIEAARAIATGLYDRWYDETVAINPHWVQTRRRLRKEDKVA